MKLSKLTRSTKTTLSLLRVEWAQNEKGKNLKEQIRTSIEQNFAKEHPFHPKVTNSAPSDSLHHNC